MLEDLGIEKFSFARVFAGQISSEQSESSTSIKGVSGFSKKFPFKGNFHDFSANFQGTYCFIPPELSNGNSRWTLTSHEIV